MGASTIDERGRVLIPKEVRERLGIHPGEKLRVETSDGDIVLRQFSSAEAVQELKGCVDESRVEPEAVREIWEA